MTEDKIVDWLLCQEYVQKELSKLREQKRLNLLNSNDPIYLKRKKILEDVLAEIEDNKDVTCYWLLGNQVAQKEKEEREKNNPVTKKKLELLDKIEKQIEEESNDDESESE